ncbi:hypothetical protein [Achromobacter insolitus]|uniref:hypothetical protein n=1 Tax=Achromobacter insolitus TaxID=217204 RepID=UPI0007C2D8B6|nr:hypothetical protein [Achromobacter insolitus]OAD17123.1 hypothetical protein A3839_24280 [Achromobacter insolitus]
MDFDWKGALGNLAPMLATALGGPLAGGAVAAITKALGLGDDATDDEISRKLADADPGTLLELKKAEQDFAARMAEYGFRSEADLARIAADDRASARQREVERQDWTPRILAYLVTAGFFGMLSVMVFAAIPAASKEPLYILLGSLGTAWTSIISYYFGSTAGGQKKSELLAKTKP